MEAGSEERGHLLRNLLLFGRLLRAAGLSVTQTQILDLVAALEYVDIGRRDDFENTAQAILVSHHQHLVTFHRAFELFWRKRSSGDLRRQPGSLMARLPEPRRQFVLSSRPAGDAAGRREAPEPRIERTYTYSPDEVLRHRDFAKLSPEELDEVRQMMRAITWELEIRRTRRKVPARRGRQVDMRRMLRRNLRHGAQPLQLVWRTRKTKRRRLIVLCDISGSMERYARLLLEFLYVVSHGPDPVEAFVFGTQLSRITRSLRTRSIQQALDDVTGAVQDWSGGTRIGQTLRTFNYRWARRVLGQGAIVLIISDGWDRGDIDLLEREMQRLQRSTHRLIWLNPLLGSPDYQPLARGIQAALPFVDDFLPVHNLHSLEQLAGRLQRLSDTRPVRRPQPNRRRSDRPDEQRTVRE